MTTSTRPAATDSYDDIEPHFHRLAALPAGPAHDAEREHIITLCLPLAEHIARRYAGRGEDLDDLTQVARVGMLKAVDRFDIGHGRPFLAFAVPTIMGEVRRHFRDATWSVRVPRPTKELQQRLGAAVDALTHRLGRMPRTREIAAELGVDVIEVTQAVIARNAYRPDSLALTESEDHQPGVTTLALGAVEPCYRLLEDAMSVRPLLAALPPRDRKILVWRFFDNLTQSQIAARLGISQMQVSRLLTQILDGLRKQASAEPRALARAA